MVKGRKPFLIIGFSVLLVSLLLGRGASADKTFRGGLFIDGKQIEDFYQENGRIYIPVDVLAAQTGIRVTVDAEGNTYLGKMPDFNYIGEQDLQLAGLKLGDSLQQAAELWGKPTAREENFSLQSFATDLFRCDGQDMMRLQSDGVDITGITIYSSVCGGTAAGVGIGDPLTKVYEIYGRPHTVAEDGTMYYNDPEGWYSLFFIPDGEKVGAIGIRDNFI